jgi:rod shape determining protein RodA
MSWPALAVALLLFGAGLACIEQAILFDSGSWIGSYAGRQLVYGFAGLVVLVGMLLPHYRTFERIAYPLYAAALVLLVFTALFGVTKNNARRWIDLGPVLLQPSELMKIALLLALARTLRHPRRRRVEAFFLACGLTLVAVVLVVRQPDLGTALLYLPVLGALLLLSGYSWKLLGGLALLAVVSIPPVVIFGLKDYQRTRVLTFLHPERQDPAGSGFHLDGSLTAVGSGGLAGAEDPEQLLFTLSRVPERHTDFVFSVVGASWGLVGTLLVLLGYALLAGLLLRIALGTREPFGRLLTAGVAVLLAFQAAVNIAMTVGLAPITGMTLPFMSYGGSSLVTSFAALGLALNVSARPVRTLARGDFS